MRILLINTNRMHPPIAPIGLEYVAAALQAAGHAPELLDLCFEHDPPGAIDNQLSGRRYDLIGLSFRKTDDCFYPGRDWFPPYLRDLVGRIREKRAAGVSDLWTELFSGRDLDEIEAGLTATA